MKKEALKINGTVAVVKDKGKVLVNAELFDNHFEDMANWLDLEDGCFIERVMDGEILLVKKLS
ncbi:MAG: hypothetical protein ACK5LP_07165 [Campylobacteraceae bacterium]